MSYTFKARPVVTVRANITGTQESISVQGVNPAVDSPELAKTQIDKILALTGSKQVDVDGMTQIATKEAFNNG